MAIKDKRARLVLPVLLMSGLANSGPLVIGDGETFLVSPGEQVATGDAVANGTFRNQGVVTHSGLYVEAGLLSGLRRNGRPARLTGGGR